jgi:hypothetical protein
MYSNVEDAYLVAQGRIADALAEADRLRLLRAAGKQRGIASLFARFHNGHGYADRPADRLSEPAGELQPAPAGPKA